MTRFSEVRLIPINRLRVSQQQVRTREVETELQDLVENIRVHGQLEPIIVVPPKESDADYEIIAGQRRWLAMKHLDAESILCGVLAGEIDDTTAHALSISENLLRRDVDSKDLIDACTRLYRKYGSVKLVSQELGLPYGRVRSYVKFDRLCDGLKAAVENGAVDISTALRIQDHFGDLPPDDQKVDELVKDVAGMTKAQVAHYLRSGFKVGNSGVAAPDRSSVRPGDVHQVLVTVSKQAHSDLRSWASEQGLSQDKAAARIITAFLRGLKTRSNTENARGA